MEDIHSCNKIAISNLPPQTTEVIKLIINRMMLKKFLRNMEKWKK